MQSPTRHSTKKISPKRQSLIQLAKRTVGENLAAQTEMSRNERSQSSASSSSQTILGRSSSSSVISSRPKGNSVINQSERRKLREMVREIPIQMQDGEQDHCIDLTLGESAEFQGGLGLDEEEIVLERASGSRSSPSYRHEQLDEINLNESLIIQQQLAAADSLIHSVVLPVDSKAPTVARISRHSNPLTARLQQLLHNRQRKQTGNFPKGPGLRVKKGRVLKDWRRGSGYKGQGVGIGWKAGNVVAASIAELEYSVAVFMQQGDALANSKVPKAAATQYSYAAGDYLALAQYQYALDAYKKSASCADQCDHPTESATTILGKAGDSFMSAGLKNPQAYKAAGEAYLTQAEYAKTLYPANPSAKVEAHANAILAFDLNALTDLKTAAIPGTTAAAKTAATNDATNAATYAASQLCAAKVHIQQVGLLDMGLFYAQDCQTYLSDSDSYQNFPQEQYSEQYSEFESNLIPQELYLF